MSPYIASSASGAKSQGLQREGVGSVSLPVCTLSEYIQSSTQVWLLQQLSCVYMCFDDIAHEKQTRHVCIMTVCGGAKSVGLPARMYLRPRHGAVGVGQLVLQGAITCSEPIREERLAEGVSHHTVVDLP